MEPSVEQIDPLSWRLELELPAAEVGRRVETRLGELRHSARVPGFRPGRAPLAQLRRVYWDAVCREQAERLAQSEVRAALAARGLRPATAPRLDLAGLPETPEALASATPRVVATFDVFPALPALDLADLKVEVPRVTIVDADVEHMLGRLREEHGRRQTASRSAARRPGTADGQPDSLRQRLVETMEQELAEAVSAERVLAVEQALVAQTPQLELPPALLASQLARLRALAPAGQAAEANALEAQARRLLTATFLCAEVARQRGIRPDPTRLWERTQQLADQARDPTAELDRIWGDGALIQDLEEELLRQDVAAAVLAEAQVTEVEMSFTELAARRRLRGVV